MKSVLGVVGCEQWSGALQLDAEERYVAARRNVFEVCHHEAESVDVPASHPRFDNVEHRRPAHEAMEHVVVLVEDGPEIPKRVVVAAPPRASAPRARCTVVSSGVLLMASTVRSDAASMCLEVGASAERGPRATNATSSPVTPYCGCRVSPRQGRRLLTGRNRRGPFTRLGRRPREVHERLGQRYESHLCTEVVDRAGQETRSQREVTGFLRRDADMHLSTASAS